MTVKAVFPSFGKPRTLFRRALVPFSLVTALLLTGCNEPSVGVVDGARAIQDSASGRRALEHVSQAQTVLQGNLTTIIKKLETYPDKRQAQTLAAQAQKQLQQQLSTFQAEVNQQMTVMLKESIQEARTAKKIAVVLNKGEVMDSDPAVDMTPLVLQQMEKKTLSLPPLPKTVTDPQLPAPNPAPEVKKDSEEKAAAKTEETPARKRKR